MPFYAKLAAFWIAVYAALWLLARYPNSRISRFLFFWHGPIPFPGERMSHYFAQWSIYSLGWLAQILLLFACGYFATLWFPSLGETMPFLAVWAFALPLLGGVALLGAVLAAGASLKAKYIGPNHVFEVAHHDPVV